MRSISSSSRFSSSGVISVLLLQLRTVADRSAGDVVGERRRSSRRSGPAAAATTPPARNASADGSVASLRQGRSRGSGKLRRAVSGDSAHAGSLRLRSVSSSALTAVERIGQRRRPRPADRRAHGRRRARGIAAAAAPARASAGMAPRRERTSGSRSAKTPATRRLPAAHAGHTSRNRPTREPSRQPPQHWPNRPWQILQVVDGHEG